MDYDVFISCKSEDYKYAEEVYDFLKGEGVNVFLASRELRRMKESEYMRSISKALDTAYHLIVFASDAENLTSKWVEFEWSTFLNEKLSGFKDGQIMTILYNVSVRQAPIELRHYESFIFENYKERLLSYVETPAYLVRKEEEKKRAQEIADARKKQEEEEKKRNLAKQELIQLAKNYFAKLSALSTDVKEIEAKMRFAGITHRICPVCQTKVELADMYCPTCGWTLSPIEGVEGAEYLLNDKCAQINLMKSVMDKPDSSQLKRIQDKLELSQKEIASLKKELAETKNVLNEERKQRPKIEIEQSKSTENYLDSSIPITAKIAICKLVKQFNLENVLDVQSEEDVMRFIRHFCEVGYKVGCSGIGSGLKVDELKNALKVLYNIDMPSYNIRNSVWSLAQNLWSNNKNNFKLLYNPTSDDNNLQNFLTRDDLLNLLRKHSRSQFIDYNVTIKYIGLCQNSLRKELQVIYNVVMPSYSEEEKVSDLIDKIIEVQICRM